jgi:hypothetical protein
MMNKKIPKFNSQESDSRTRVLRPQIDECVKPVKTLSDNTVDKLAEAIRKSWIGERSNGRL